MIRRNRPSRWSPDRRPIAVTALLLPLLVLLLISQPANGQSTGDTPDDGARRQSYLLFMPAVGGEISADDHMSDIGGNEAAGTSNIDGAWANPRNDLGEMPVACEYIDNSPEDITGENQVRYGQPFGLSTCGEPVQRSGFGFDGANALEFLPGQVFLLGQFTHYNENVLPAAVPMDFVDLNIDLRFAIPSLQISLDYTMQLDETLNNQRPCPYGATTDDLCNDKADFVNNTPQQNFTVDGKAYTLEIVGFVPGTMADCAYSSSMVDYFITAEQQRNDACIFARIIEPAPAIQVVKEPDLQAISAGDSAEFTVTVRNIGTVGLGSVAVDDPNSPDCTRTIGEMKAGSAASYVCTAFDIEHDFENIAAASGVFAGVTYTDTDNAFVDVLAPDTGTVRVVKYADTNANGQRDNGEPGLPGWRLCLRNAEGATVGICRDTGLDGVAYLAANANGSFTACEELQPGWRNTDPGGGALCKPVTLTSGPLYAELAPTPQNIYGVELIERSSDQLVWTYAVAQYLDSKNVTRWTLALPPCIDASQIDPIGTTPGYTVGIDDLPGGSGLRGIYWDTPNGVNASGTPFQVRFRQYYDAGATLAGVTAAVDDGTSAAGAIVGPVCNDIVLLGNTPAEAVVTTLEVRKNLLPAGDAGRFDLLIDGVVRGSAVANNGTTGKLEVTPGVHTVGETPVAGVAVDDYTSSASCTETNSGATWTPDAQGRVQVDAGDEVVCTFTNVRKGAITIVKDTGGGTAGADWEYGGTLGAFTLPAAGGQRGFVRLLPGTYLVSEAPQAGWVLASLQCTDPDGGSSADLRGATATVDLDPGETVTCTFVGSVQAGRVTIVKEVDGAATADWQFGGDLGAFALPAAGGSRTFDSVAPGIVRITEERRPDWYVQSLVCSDPDGGSTVLGFDGIANVDVDAGEAIVCTYRNKQATPAIALDKTASAATVYPNTLVTYTFLATNPGQMPLAGVTVDDPLCAVTPLMTGVRNVGDTSGDGLLDPGETWRYRCELTLVADTYNRANVTGVAPSGQTVTAADDATVKVIVPTLAIRKQASAPTIYRGESVTYTIVISNAGNVPLTGVTVEDGMPACALVPSSNGNGDQVLDSSERWVFTCTVMLTEDTVNTAIVTALDPNGQRLTAEASVAVDVAQPHINIEKSVDRPYAYPGERVTFTLRVLNSGDSPLTNVVVEDSLPQCTLSAPSGDQGNDGRLDPGEQWFLTCSVPVCEKTVQGAALLDGEVAGACVPDELCDDFVNTATVRGTDPFGREWTDSDTVEVDVMHPAIVVTKQVNKPIVNAGEAVTFTVGVKNSGDVVLTRVDVTDTLPACILSGPVGDDGNGRLDVEEEWLYTCSLALQQDTTNGATAVAVDPNGKEVSGSASVDVEVNSVAPPCEYPSGGTVSWVEPAGGALAVYMVPPNGEPPRGIHTPIFKLERSNGDVEYGYCLDAELDDPIDVYCLEGGISDCRLAYLLSKYPPNLENAAIQAGQQAAVWHYTNPGYDLYLDDPALVPFTNIDTVVRETYLAILHDVEAHAGTGGLCTQGDVEIVVTPPTAINELPAQPQHPFTVRLTKGGAPLPNQEVFVTADFGTLSPASALTNENGEAFFTIVSPATGTATITATATVLVPTSTRFSSKDDPLGRQPIGLPGTQTITVVGRATKTWIIGPGAAAVAPPEPEDRSEAANRIFLPVTIR